MLRSRERPFVQASARLGPMRTPPRFSSNCIHQPATNGAKPCRHISKFGDAAVFTLTQGAHQGLDNFLQSDNQGIARIAEHCRGLFLFPRYHSLHRLGTRIEVLEAR